MLGITFKLRHTILLNKRKPPKGDSKWLAEHLTCFSTADLKCALM